MAGFSFFHYGPLMIPFDEIDLALKSLKRDRAWLAEVSGRSADSIRGALAPNAPAAKRSELLQKALSDAIEKERIKQESAKASQPANLPDRVTIDCLPEERRQWQKASGGDLDSWIVETLNSAANHQLGINPSMGNARPYPLPKEKEA